MYIGIYGYEKCQAQWCRLGAIHNYDIWFRFKRDALERKRRESTNILMESRQPSPSRNIFTDTGCWKIGIYTSCFLLIWRWIQVFLCRKISLALPNCNYACWGEKSDANAFSQARENVKKLGKILRLKMNIITCNSVFSHPLSPVWQLYLFVLVFFFFWLKKLLHFSLLPMQGHSAANKLWNISLFKG